MKEEKDEIKELESARREMQALWNQMQNCGVKLFVDGEAVSPTEAVARTVREDSPYMADYVMEDSGRISQVCFHKVESQ